jgi:hypothetical protein
MKRRAVLASLLLPALPIESGPAAAQDVYPSRPIQMIVPFPPGGVADITGRPIDLPALTETAALGAVLLAGLGSGVYHDVAAATRRVCRVERTIEPDPAEPIYLHTMRGVGYVFRRPA